MVTKPNVYKKSPYFQDTKIVSEVTLTTNLVINFNLIKLTMRSLSDNQKALVLDLQEIFKRIGLVPFKK